MPRSDGDGAFLWDRGRTLPLLLRLFWGLLLDWLFGLVWGLFWSLFWGPFLNLTSGLSLYLLSGLTSSPAWAAQKV